MEKHYTNGDITVVWRPEACTHSTLCWRGLIEVFNPRRRPWVDMAGATSVAIIAQVEKCPSKALSWFRGDTPPAAGEPTQQAETTIEIQANGPLLVHGPIVIRDASGHETVVTKSMSFCRCGASANKPYCDGSHGRIGFVG